jgi:hypothetical protein
MKNGSSSELWNIIYALIPWILIIREGFQNSLSSWISENSLKGTQEDIFL